MRRGMLVAVVGVVLLSGCGQDTDVATWTLPAGEKLDAATTRFAVDVTRLTCNGGVTGIVNRPSIRVADDHIVITFTVSPGPPASADCQGNDLVPYDVVLPEPLGTRKLLDGICELDAYDDTTPCANGGLRYPN